MQAMATIEAHLGARTEQVRQCPPQRHTEGGGGLEQNNSSHVYMEKLHGGTLEGQNTVEHAMHIIEAQCELEQSISGHVHMEQLHKGTPLGGQNRAVQAILNIDALTLGARTEQFRLFLTQMHTCWRLEQSSSGYS